MTSSSSFSPDSTAWLGTSSISDGWRPLSSWEPWSSRKVLQTLCIVQPLSSGRLLPTGFGLNFSAARPSVDRRVYKIKVFSSRSSEWCSVRPTLNYFKSTRFKIDPSQSDQVLQFGLNHTYGSGEHLTEASCWPSWRLLKVAWPTWSYVTFDLKRRHHICRLPYLSEFQDQIRNNRIPRFFSYITHHSGAGGTFDVSMTSPKGLPGRWRRSEGLNLPPVWITLTQNTQKKNQLRFQGDSWRSSEQLDADGDQFQKKGPDPNPPRCRHMDWLCWEGKNGYAVWMCVKCVWIN